MGAGEHPVEPDASSLEPTSSQQSGWCSPRATSSGARAPSRRRKQQSSSSKRQSWGLSLTPEVPPRTHPVPQGPGTACCCRQGCSSSSAPSKRGCVALRAPPQPRGQIAMAPKDTTSVRPDVLKGTTLSASFTSQGQPQGQNCCSSKAPCRLLASK